MTRPPVQRVNVLALAIAGAVTVANIYFPQPLLEAIAHSLEVSEDTAGLIASAAQIGYAVGILLIVPLADAVDVRRLSTVLLTLTCGGLLVAAIAPNPATLAVATLAVSTTTVLPQIIMPVVASLAGPREAVGAFAARLGDRVPARLLRTGHAFHSAAMAPAVPKLLAELSGIRTHRPSVPYLANVTGRFIEPGTSVDAGLLAEQVRRTVRFADGLTALAERLPDAVVVEIGPGRALSSLTEAAGLTTIALAPAAPERPAPGPPAALGALWTAGQPVDLDALCADGRRTRLPGYPFAGPRLIAPEARAGAARPQTPAPAPAPAPASAPVADPVTAAVTEDTGAESGTGAATRTSAATAPADARTAVTRAWRQVLGRVELSDDADFFELGGDSPLITRVTAQVSQELGVKVPVRDMLVARTLGGHTGVVAGLLTACGSWTPSKGRSPRSLAPVPR
ncbi:MFS transporter [Streptomyces jumonjinensis]|uniref:MFS transporter n=1 Tax=Streptomyces jumonjinensis TaxID=1945 RepID=UPI0037B5F1AF